jgi:excisionase family DNA binding protein
MSLWGGCRPGPELGGIGEQHISEGAMIVRDGEEFLTAHEACSILGIKPATLYAYVSRGLLDSYRQGIKRMRLYRRAEVEALTRLHRPNAGEDASAASDMQSDDEPADANTTEWTSYV